MNDNLKMWRNVWDFKGSKELLEKIIHTIRSGQSFDHLMEALPEQFRLSKCLNGAPLQNCQLDGLNLRGISFDYADMKKANFKDSFLPECSFIGTELQNACFSGAFLEKVMFGTSDLSFTDFSGAFLKESHFGLANLENTNFSNADIEAAIFLRAKNIDTSIFKGVDVSKARFLFC